MNDVEMDLNVLLCVFVRVTKHCTFQRRSDRADLNRIEPNRTEVDWQLLSSCCSCLGGHRLALDVQI